MNSHENRIGSILPDRLSLRHSSRVWLPRTMRGRVALPLFSSLSIRPTDHLETSQKPGAPAAASASGLLGTSSTQPSFRSNESTAHFDTAGMPKDLFEIQFSRRCAGQSINACRVPCCSFKLHEDVRALEDVVKMHEQDLWHACFS